MPVVILIVVIIALVVIVNCVKIVPQAHAVVVERLGGYLTTWSVGLHFKVPFIDRIAKRVLLKEQVVDFPPQPVITKDNVTMQIDTVVYFQITDPKLYAYGVENPIMAIENLTATTLRNIIGDLELDETLTSRGCNPACRGTEGSNHQRGRRSGRGYIKDPAGQCRWSAYAQRSCSG